MAHAEIWFPHGQNFICCGLTSFWRFLYKFLLEKTCTSKNLSNDSLKITKKNRKIAWLTLTGIQFLHPAGWRNFHTWQSAHSEIVYLLESIYSTDRRISSKSNNFVIMNCLQLWLLKSMCVSTFAITLSSFFCVTP